MLLKLCKQKRKEKQTLELKMRYKKRCLYYWITLLILLPDDTSIVGRCYRYRKLPIQVAFTPVTSWLKYAL